MTTIRAIPQYDIASDASRLVSALRRSVVEIRSPVGGGAGIIWGGAGLVVTNAHCVRKNASLTIEVNGETHSVESVAFARDHDLALIHAPSISGPLLELRDVDTLRPGEIVFAYGHPLGVSHALAMGALHGVVRDKRTGDPRFITADIRLPRRGQQYDRGRFRRCHPFGRCARVRDTRHQCARGVIIHSG